MARTWSRIFFSREVMSSWSRDKLSLSWSDAGNTTPRSPQTLNFALRFMRRQNLYPRIRLLSVLAAPQSQNPPRGTTPPEVLLNAPEQISFKFRRDPQEAHLRTSSQHPHNRTGMRAVSLFTNSHCRHRAPRHSARPPAVSRLV